MEASPRLPALAFDYKLSIESVNLCEKIPQYIVSHYQEKGDNYASECEQINQLRQQALHGSQDESIVQCLKRYYCQLLLLRNRFPMLPDTECCVRFTWEDAFQKDENTFNDIRFEEASVLYNLGAIYSKQGASESRKTHESMKNACTYFRCAAACFEKVRDQYTTYSIDFTPDLLTCQVQILLAQAHEAVLEKSLLDQRPPSVNAHLAMQIAEYYQTALVNLLKPDINSIVSKRFREWRVALTYKVPYYLSMTYYCCGLLADENKKRGEAVCYYENAAEQLKEAWKNATKISSDRSSIYKDAHTYTLELVTEKCKIAKRDNDSVYFEKVPALASLPTMQGAIVAKPQFFDCHDSAVSGADIFQKLVPMDAHLAASEYSEEKAKLVRQIMELIDEKNIELQTFMMCLQLDRIPLSNEYLRLPRELLDCCAAAATRPHMIKDLIAAMQQLNSQHHDVTEQISACEQSLEQPDEASKSNDAFKDIQSQVQSMKPLMVQANESNVELHRHMTSIIEHVKLIHSPLDQLEQTLPVIPELDDETIKPKLARLGLLLEKVETMKKQRETLLNDFRRKINEDDITKHVLMQRQENHKTLFAAQMKKHEELVNIIKQNCRAQENIIQSMTEANASIADVRNKIIGAHESRRRLIQECIHSFQSFDETLSKAAEGIEFYKKQTEKLNSLHQRLAKLQVKPQSKPSVPVRSPSHQNLSNPPIEVPRIPDRPRLKDYLATMKPETWGSTASNRSLNKVDETFYIPPPIPNINGPHQAYTHSMPATFNVANPMDHTPTSTTSFNPQPYQVQSNMYSNPSSLPTAIQASQPSQSFIPQHAVPYQHANYTLCNNAEQNFSSQSQVPYPPSNAQNYYQQPQFYPPQPMHPSYPPAPAPPPMSYSCAQPYPSHYQPNVPNASMYSNAEPQRSAQQPVPLGPKFDPYRPQPVGAYDIPRPPMLNPQDVYRPGGLLGMKQGPILSGNASDHSYEQNQYVPSSSFANLSVSSLSNH